MTIYIGADIGKDFFDVATTEQLKAKRFKSTPEGYQDFLKWLPTEQSIHIAMEATGKYSLGLALKLYEQGIPVSVVNPARIKRYGQSQLQRVKTDSEDAKLIAHFCMTQTPKLWQPERPVVAQLQEQYKFQELLIQQHVQIENQLQSSLSDEVQLFQRQQLAHLSKQLTEAENKIKKCLSCDAQLTQQVKLLSSIKGFGETTAIRLVTLIKDINRFEKAKQLALQG